MLNNIKEFLSKLNPDILIQAPSRINLINPLDAVEGDFWMPSVAINGKHDPLSVFLYIKKLDQESRLKIYRIKQTKSDLKLEVVSEETLTKKKSEILKKLSKDQRLIYATIYRLLKMNSCFNEKFLKSNIEIGLLSTIPPQSGLGGSTAIIIAVIYGLACYFNLYNNLNTVKHYEYPINKDIIAEIATKVEDKDLKVTSGYSDRYIISRGGLGFCSYFGKLYHKDISHEPLAIFDRIDETYEIISLPIIICFSGVTHDSGDVHGKLRKLYLQQDPKIVNNYKKLAELAWKSRFALMKHDWKLLGEFFKENTRIMNKVMERAGFEYGIGLVNNILIELIEEHRDVYAAKLTGAGNGGSVFALVNPDKIESILKYWKDKLIEIIEDKRIFISKFPTYPVEITEQLKNARFYQVEIDRDGVKKI
ncbi:MAG: mevalonate kinase [Candidatus Hodarchaeota archaeon]